MAEEGKDKEKKEGDEKAPEAAAPAAGGGKKKMLLIGGVVGLVLLIGVPVIIFGMKGKEKPAIEGGELVAPDAAQESDVPKAAEGANEQDELVEGEEPLGAIFPLDTFVVNLSGGNFIRAQLQLEFAGRDIPKRFYTKLVPIRDGIITLLTQKKAEDLAEQKGKDALRVEVKDLVNETLHKEEVKRVYYTQFVIQ